MDKDTLHLKHQQSTDRYTLNNTNANKFLSLHSCCYIV